MLFNSIVSGMRLCAGNVASIDVSNVGLKYVASTPYYDAVSKFHVISAKCSSDVPILDFSLIQFSIFKRLVLTNFCFFFIIFFKMEYGRPSFHLPTLHFLCSGTLILAKA